MLTRTKLVFSFALLLFCIYSTKLYAQQIPQQSASFTADISWIKDSLKEIKEELKDIKDKQDINYKETNKKIDDLNKLTSSTDGRVNTLFWFLGGLSVLSVIANNLWQRRQQKYEEKYRIPYAEYTKIMKDLNDAQETIQKMQANLSERVREELKKMTTIDEDTKELLEQVKALELKREQPEQTQKKTAKY